MPGPIRRSGLSLVLIHGWPLSGKAWADNIAALTAAGHRVITYDRRGFGESDKPVLGYGYDKLADDLAAPLDTLDLRDVTLVGFSTGGGEVARHLSRHGQDRLRSVVFASAVTPYLMHGSDSPDGPLTKAKAAKMTAQPTADSDSFYDGFITDFFTAGDRLCVTEEQTSAGDRAEPAGGQARRTRGDAVVRTHRLPGGPRHRTGAGDPR